MNIGELKEFTRRMDGETEVVVEFGGAQRKVANAIVVRSISKENGKLVLEASEEE